MPSSLAPREIRHRCSYLGRHHSRTRSGVDRRAHESRDPLHQPLPPRRHARLRGVVVAHMPPRSAVAPPQPLPRHRRAHLKGSLPRASQGDAVALEPHGIRRRGRCHKSPSCALHGAAAACVPSGSDVAAAPTSPPCAPHGSAAASVSPRSAVALLLPGSAVVRASQGWGRNCRRR
jgi:hypothetical protein